MEKLFLIVVLLIFTINSNAQGWEPQSWKSYITKQKTMPNGEKKEGSLIVNRYANEMSVGKDNGVFYGAFYATRPMSFASASPCSDYIPPRKEKKMFLSKRTSQEVYEDNQDDFEKIRRGEYTTCDWLLGLFRDVLEAVLTK